MSAIEHCWVRQRAVDEGRKRVIGVMAAILASLHMQTADDLFGGPQGSPRTDKLIAASIQWAERIMTRIDEVFREVNMSIKATAVVKKETKVDLSFAKIRSGSSRAP